MPSFSRHWFPTALLLATFLTAATAAEAAPAVECASLTRHDLSDLPGAPTRIVTAAAITQAGVAICEVTGYIAPHTRFRVTLPTATWKGRYLQMGCGGLCGEVRTTPPPASAGCAALADGETVVATNDQGHFGANITDALWGHDDPDARIEFAYRSEHRLAVAAKAIIAAFYGRDPLRSYYDGCSGGGRQALGEAQRYPDDFDGILAGAPVLDATGLAGILEPWIVRSNTDATGRQILGPDKLGALHAAVKQRCAGADGLIADPRVCDFDPASMRCPATVDRPDCLTAAQVDVVRRFYLGPRDDHGRTLYPGGGLPYGSELAWASWDIAPTPDPQAVAGTIAAQLGLNYLKHLAFVRNPPAGFGLGDVEFTPSWFRAVSRLSGAYDTLNPDLSRFRARGGRLILYHGWADQATPPFASLSYYEQVVNEAGGYDASQRFSRLYMVPGQYHCLAVGGGDPQVTADLLTPLIDWVERGAEPGRITLPVVSAPRTITVAPTDPTERVVTPKGGLNGPSRWIGRFRSDDTLWCTERDGRLRCTTRRPPGA